MSADEAERARVVAYGAAALDAETRAITAARPGGRQEALNKSAFALGRLVGAGVP